MDELSIREDCTRVLGILCGVTEMRTCTVRQATGWTLVRVRARLERLEREGKVISFRRNTWPRGRDRRWAVLGDEKENEHVQPNL